MLNNQHGWGLKEMLFYSAIIFFFVILAFVLINNLYGDLKQGSNQQTLNSSYKDVEKQLLNAAKKYSAKHPELNLVISEELVQEGYITNAQMSMGNDKCSGYVDITNLSSYITCNNYETVGY